LRRHLEAIRALLLAAACSTACRSAPPNEKDAGTRPAARSPKVRRHAPIVQGPIEVGAFERAGCKRTDDFLDCKGVEGLEKLGCVRLWVSADLGALSRRIPVAACPEEATRAHPWRIPGPGVLESGCLLRVRTHYVIHRAGAFSRLSTPDEFRAAYAPLGTAAEATGVVIATTGATTRYEPSKEHKVLVDELDEAFAEPTPGGFKVHLFESASCGCDAHPRYEVDYLVSRTGAVSIGAKRVVDEIPAGRVCID
jgi:hypothetical protein